MSLDRASEPGHWLTLLEQRRLSVAAASSPCDWFLDTPRLAPVMALARRVAGIPTVPVIVRGERGVGVAELCRFLHDEARLGRSGRLWRLPAAEAGSPARRGGVGEGTLVIDDIEDLGADGQAWLKDLVGDRLRTGRSVRLVATSRLDVEALLARPGLDQELVHALDVVRLEIPALRDRPEEILPLARRYLRHFARTLQCTVVGFSPGAEERLLAHRYPANVRELRNTIERAVALETSGEIQPDAIVFHEERPPAGVGRWAGRGAAISSIPRLAALMQGPRLPTLAEVEREYLIALIRELRGRRVLMARAMGLSYPTVVKRIAQHGLDIRAILTADQDRGGADDSLGLGGPARPVRAGRLGLHQEGDRAVGAAK
jgi:DNA-binding NtrC family response regulator